MTLVPAHTRAASLARFDELELEIEKLVTGGAGLGRHQGVPILVERSAPGDRVRVRLVERRPDYGRAEILEILRPGPGRRAAPCPYFERCGGCDLQHLTEEAQTAAKVDSALETLRRVGGVVVSGEPAVFRGDAWGYRLRAQLQVERGAVGEAPRVGYHARRSHQVVAVEHCPILAPELDRLVAILPRVLPDNPPRRLDLASDGRGEVGCAPVVEGLPHGELRISIEDYELGFDARCFVQTHRGLLATLVRAALDREIPRAGESPAEPGLAYDLYAGVGLFSVPLARLYGQVICVEGERVAAHFARRNLKRNGARAAQVIHQRVERFVERLEPGAARVLVDPPRSGLPLQVRSVLLERPPDKLTYVSCQPATLARDLGHLARRFEVEKLSFVDLFPQTSHIETVVQLAARPAPGSA